MKKAGVLLLNLVLCLSLNGQDPSSMSSSDLWICTGIENGQIKMEIPLSDNSHRGHLVCVPQLNFHRGDSVREHVFSHSMNDSSAVSLIQVNKGLVVPDLTLGRDRGLSRLGTGLFLLNQGGNETAIPFKQQAPSFQKFSISFKELEDWMFWELTSMDGQPETKRVTIKSLLPKYLPVNFKESSIESEVERELQILNEWSVTNLRNLEHRDTRLP